MPSLKEYIKTLFKLSGSQAMPSNSIIQVGAPENGVALNYTAPSDGYFCLRIVNATNATLAQIETTKNRILSLIPTNSSFGAITIPVKKGETVSAIARYEAKGESTCIFVPTVGAS